MVTKIGSERQKESARLFNMMLGLKSFGIPEMRAIATLVHGQEKAATMKFPLLADLSDGEGKLIRPFSTLTAGEKEFIVAQLVIDLQAELFQHHVWGSILIARPVNEKKESKAYLLWIAAVMIAVISFALYK